MTAWRSRRRFESLNQVGSSFGKVQVLGPAAIIASTERGRQYGMIHPILWRYLMHCTIRVVGAAIVRANTVLVARRSAQMAMAGKWEFPGGKVEEGEAPGEALRRELCEELDVDIRVGERIGTGESQADGARIVLDVYRCRLVSGEPSPHEHDDVIWAGPEALGALDWADADIPIAHALARLLNEGRCRDSLGDGF